MKPSSLAKLKLLLSRETAYSGHANDQAFLHDFLYDYVLNHQDDGSESDIREQIEKYSTMKEPLVLRNFISEVLTSYNAIIEFIKRSKSPTRPPIDYIF